MPRLEPVMTVTRQVRSNGLDFIFVSSLNYPMPSLRGAQATKQSIFPLLRHGLLRGACHRARIRATRWLAMTTMATLRSLDLVIARSEATKQSILPLRGHGLLRFARNDGRAVLAHVRPE